MEAITGPYFVNHDFMYRNPEKFNMVSLLLDMTVYAVYIYIERERREQNCWYPWKIQAKKAVKIQVQYLCIVSYLDVLFQNLQNSNILLKKY